MTHTVYLAGPISGLGFDGCTEWRDSVIAILAEVGIKGLSPMRAKEYLRHAYDAVGGFSATCEEYAKLSPLSGPRGIMTRDRFDATRCDVLLVNLLGADRISVGTVMEIAWADLCRTPIVCAMEPGNIHEHAMVGEAIGFRCSSLGDAVHVVKAILA
jgi:nucleoside 2-deoxyribosyltransferase